MSDIPGLPLAFRLRLYDAEGRVHWEPDGEELRATGMVFAAVLGILYDGSRARASLALNRGHLLSMAIAAPQRAGDEETEQMTDALSARMRRHGLAHAFSLSARSDVFPDETYITDYWWVWKRHLASALAATWSQRSAGVVAPRPDEGGLAKCFQENSPCRLLRSLLSACKLVFQGDGAGEGESMIVLSHHLSIAEIKDALDHTSVRRALRQLDEKARLVDWVFRKEEIGGRTYTVREKPGGDTNRSSGDTILNH